MARKLNALTAEQLLACVPGEKAFYVAGGRTISSLEELSRALGEMSPEQFSHHRNREKNDFYNWVIHVIGDARLANDLARAKTQRTTRKKVEERIDFLRKMRGETP